jgi:hypothetical protein
MSSRKGAAASASGNDHAPGMAVINDYPRQQMAAATQAACALFHGFEAIRRIQQKTAHQALAHYQQVAERLKEPCPPMELLTVQAELARFDMQGAAMYWQQLGMAMLGMEREMLAACLAATPHLGEAEEAAGAAAYGPMAGMSPFFFSVEAGRQAPHA